MFLLQHVQCIRSYYSTLFSLFFKARLKVPNTCLNWWLFEVKLCLFAETQNSNQPVLMVVLNLKKNTSKCGLYFHPFVVCKKINEETLDKYQLIKHHDMERSTNVQSLKLSEVSIVLSKTYLNIKHKIKNSIRDKKFHYMTIDLKMFFRS